MVKPQNDMDDLDDAGELVEAVAGELEAQSNQLVIDAERLLLDIAAAIQRQHRALQLWELWFRRFGDPWFRGEDGKLWCAFCDGTDHVHKRGCIYKAAKRLTRDD